VKDVEVQITMSWTIYSSIMEEEALVRREGEGAHRFGRGLARPMKIVFVTWSQLDPCEEGFFIEEHYSKKVLRQNHDAVVNSIDHRLCSFHRMDIWVMSKCIRFGSQTSCTVVYGIVEAQEVLGPLCLAVTELLHCRKVL
jgi:hypothetical protein